MKIFKLYIDAKNYALVTASTKKMQYATWNVNDFSKITSKISLDRVINEKKSMLADFSSFGTDFPFSISNKGIDVADGVFPKSGIVKSAYMSDDNTMMNVFWPTIVIDCLDEKKSTIEVFPGGYQKLVKAVFDENKIMEPSIFLVPQFMTNSLFVTEDIANKLIESELEGVILIDAEIPRHN